MSSVVEFARKTGDFASLSSVDIKVLSLTLTLELEKNGEKFLHSEPKVRLHAGCA